MMKQYNDAKAAAGDALLLFRMGDFYELFFDDAYKAADALGITVTSRDRNKGPDATPMAGFPHHQLDTYLARLISAGFRVAVCEQLEDPKKAKTIVKREVVRIVTPGTVTDDAILDPKSSNYLAAIAVPAKCRLAVSPNDLEIAPTSGAEESASHRTASIHPDETVGLSWVELSTGEFFAATLPFRELSDQLAGIQPSELLVAESSALFFPKKYAGAAMTTVRPDWTFHHKTAVETLLRHFKVKTLEGFGFSDPDAPALHAAGAVLDYLRETQKQSLSHIETLTRHQSGEQLEIDQSSRRSLELFRSGHEGRREGSLLWALDDCVTPSGSRLIAEWLTYPLTAINKIRLRQDAVEELLGSGNQREEFRDRLRSVCDLARIMARVIQERVSPRELAAVGRTLQILPFFRESLVSCGASLLQTLGEHIFPLTELAAELSAALGDDCPLSGRDGGFIRTGYNAELDEYRELGRGGKQWLASYQASESARTGIPTLKVGFNSVFGYYIEVTRLHSDKIPPEYVRKQTLKNAERYITEELKIYEEKVLGAEEKAKALEYDLFVALREKVAAERGKIQRSAGALAMLDALGSLAQIAAKYHYTRPTMVEEPVLHVREGRHPVLERTEESGTFVPNDADCGGSDAMIHLITGPNMAGKSTFIRQVALLVIMAQTGSFLPASEAEIGVVDRVFARVGASDELTRGLSTFMVEMIETARILNGATAKSLVVLDEIGRGTSTYDGISLAWAIAESLHERIGCRTFFATHYHELTDLAETCPGIDNLNVAVREWDDEIAFLHKIVPGSADRSYGIHVARLAGVPPEVIRRAKKILTELEDAHLDAARGAIGGALKSVAATPFLESAETASEKTTRSAPVQFSLFGPEDHPVVEEIRSLDVNSLTPLDALTLLARLKKTIDEGDRKKKKR